MRDCWLRTNVRALLFGLILATLLGAAGAALIIIPFASGTSWMARSVGGLLVVIAIITVAVLLLLIRLPRIAYRDDQLLLYLNRITPIKLPVDVVECFFLGQAPSLMKPRRGQEVRTSTVVVRLAEAAKQWHQRDVNPLLGQWCGGYITIRGTWCEPLTSDVFSRLNRRLVEEQRRQKQTSKATSS